MIRQSLNLCVVNLNQDEELYYEIRAATITHHVITFSGCVKEDITPDDTNDLPASKNYLKCNQLMYDVKFTSYISDTSSRAIYLMAAATSSQDTTGATVAFSNTVELTPGTYSLGTSGSTMLYFHLPSGEIGASYYGNCTLTSISNGYGISFNNIRVTDDNGNSSIVSGQFDVKK